MLDIGVFQHVVKLVDKGRLDNFGLVYSSSRWRRRRHAIGIIGIVARDIVRIGYRRVLGSIAGLAVAIGFGVGVVVAVRRWRR
jgi:hypothetical protein